MTILITGFEPFLDHESNPTQDVLTQLGTEIHGHAIHTVLLPVLYDKAFDILLPLLEEYRPDLVLMLGLASGSKHIRLERIAINLSDSLHPDNAGIIHHNQTILADGDTAYFSTLPLDAIQTQLQQNSVPVTISNTAGLYVCNNLFYHMMHHIKTNHLTTLAGFIHVPDVSSDTVELSLSSIRDAIFIICKTILNEKE